MGSVCRRNRHRPGPTREDLVDSRRRPVRENVVEGITLGMVFAGLLSILAGLSLLLAIPGAGFVAVARMWGLPVVFYIGAGILGGAVCGLLRRVQDRYWGRFLTAYLRECVFAW